MSTQVHAQMKVPTKSSNPIQQKGLLHPHTTPDAKPLLESTGVYESLRSPGQPLDPATRANMEGRFGHSFSRINVHPVGRAVPSALTVNQAGDRHEQEADRILNMLMQAREARPQQSSTDLIDNKTGYDFSQVRVHTDAQANMSARAVNARAYTVGTDIVFRAGQFSPHTLEGQRILSHELIHVLQQSGMGGMTYAGPRIQRAPTSEEDESWWDKLKHEAADVKAKAYKAILDRIREDTAKQKNFLRSQVPKLPQGAQSAANTIIDVYAFVLDMFIALDLAVIGLVVGFVSGIISLIESIIKLTFGISKLFLLYIAGIFSKQYRSDFVHYVHQISAAISHIPDGVRRIIADWWDKYQKASPEDQVLMGSELVGQIEALIATIGLAEAEAAQGANVAGGGARLALAPAGGVLEEAPVVATASAPAAAGAIAATVPKAGILGGGQLLMKGGEQEGGSKTPTEESKEPEAASRKPGKPAAATRKEPSLKKEAYWGPPRGGGGSDVDRAYALKVTGSSESLYVEGTDTWVEFDGYRDADKVLLDAKNSATEGSFYEIESPPDKFTRNVKIPKVLDQADRQLDALKGSGAKGIEWHVASKSVERALKSLFSQRGVAITVKWTKP